MRTKNNAIGVEQKEISRTDPTIRAAHFEDAINSRLLQSGNTDKNIVDRQSNILE